MQNKLPKTLQDKIERLKLFGMEPDRELQLWTDWAKIRKEEVVELANRTQRSPADLVMNLLEQVREDKERKTTLEHAQIKPLPTVRGSFWERPPKLRERCTCWKKNRIYCLCEPVYEIQRTRAEIGRPRVMEYIGVPGYIQENEKGLTGVVARNPCTLIDAEYEKYKNKRENDLKERIVKIDPFRPDMSELLVIGSKPKPPPKKPPALPSIITTEPVWQCRGALCTVYALRINNTVVYKDIAGYDLSPLRKMQQENWHESTFTWTYYFNVPVNRVGRAKLFLQNLGTVTLRYCWKKMKRLIPFIPERVYEQNFYFCKNEDVLSPGQCKELFFTFVSDKPGIYSEVWEFSLCNISLFEALSDKFIFNLAADSVENAKKITKKIEKLQCRIDRKVSGKLVSDILEDIVVDVTMEKPQIYPYEKYFLEAQIFVMKNPVCFYHQTEVNSMKEKYIEMAPGATWDLSINTWREEMIKKDFDERMACYEFLKKSHAELLKPWYEGSDLLEEKYRTMKVFLGQFADKFYDEYHRISKWNGVISESEGTSNKNDQTIQSPVPVTSLTPYTIQNLFYLTMYDQLGTTIETCVGILRSLELNRWIEFDFCRI